MSVLEVYLFAIYAFINRTHFAGAEDYRSLYRSPRGGYAGAAHLRLVEHQSRAGIRWQP